MRWSILQVGITKNARLTDASSSSPPDASTGKSPETNRDSRGAYAMD